MKQRGLQILGLLALLCMASALHAQLSSPVPSTSPLVIGSGPGVHSPNSPIAPLPQRSDVLAWSLLTDVKTRTEKNRVLPVFTMNQLALHQKTQRVQGFMMPLGAGERQIHFLLSAVPLTCNFCTPGGPESMVEVRAKEPVRYTQEPVIVQGRFLVLNDDPYGMYYRITDAVSVK